MPRDPASPHWLGASALSRPWPLLVAGLACAASGWIVSSIDSVPVAIRLLLLFGGTLVMLSAVITRMRQTAPDFMARLETAALISIAGGAAVFFGYRAMDSEWDSGKMFFAAVFILAEAGALLLLLPPLFRRLAVSLMILFHFAGMGVAITSVDPPNTSGSWLSKQLWTHVYRPYLSFMYLTNAYHFYSPDPGPPGLMWFAVHYSDGKYMWVKMPNRETSPIGMHYQRLLALPEHSFQVLPRLPLSQAELHASSDDQKADYEKRGLFDPRRGSWEEIYRRRELGSTFLFPAPPEAPDKKPLPIPMVLNVDAIIQYREPGPSSKKVLACVAKRILWDAPQREGAKAVSVKMYRLTHRIITPYELSKGKSPLDKTKYLPYFLGEFDREGKIKDPLDPFLYWYLPIAEVPRNYPDHGLATRPAVPAIIADIEQKDGFLLDCLEMHAAGRITKQEKK